MLRTRNLVLALVASVAFGGVVSANTTYRYSGHACKHRDVADTLWWYDSEGLRYNNTGQDFFSYAWCPVMGWQGSSVDLDGASVFYNDGQQEYSISCQLFVTNNTGGVFSSTTRYSCGADTINGCTTGAYGSTEAGKTGYGSISWSGTNLPNSGSSISNVGPYGFFCGLPSEVASNPLGGPPVNGTYSKIMSYNVNQVGL